MTHYLPLQFRNHCSECGKELPKGTRVAVEWQEHENHARILCDLCVIAQKREPDVV